MLADILVWGAGGSFVLGYLIINQVALRLVHLIGSIFYLLFYLVVSDPPLWNAFYVSVLYTLANILGLSAIMMRRSAWLIPTAFRDLAPLFPNMAPGDLRAIFRHATRQTITDDHVITREGQPVDQLYFVIHGEMQADKLGHSFPVPAGVFVGEVAYMSEAPSSATVTLKAGSEVVIWPVHQLKRQARRNPRAKLALDSAISRDLAAKVRLAVAPNRLPEGIA